MRPVAPSSDQSNSACSPGSGDPEIRKTMGFFFSEVGPLTAVFFWEMDGNGWTWMEMDATLLHVNPLVHGQIPLSP